MAEIQAGLLEPLHPPYNLRWSLTVNYWKNVGGSTYGHGEFASYWFHGAWGAPTANAGRGHYSCPGRAPGGTCHVVCNDAIRLLIQANFIETKGRGLKGYYAGCFDW